MGMGRECDKQLIIQYRMGKLSTSRDISLQTTSPSNVIRQTAREYVYVRSRDKDGGHIIQCDYLRRSQSLGGEHR